MNNIPALPFFRVDTPPPGPISKEDEIFVKVLAQTISGVLMEKTITCNQDQGVESLQKVLSEIDEKMSKFDKSVKTLSKNFEALKDDLAKQTSEMKKARKAYTKAMEDAIPKEEMKNELEKVQGNLVSHLNNISSSDKILEELRRERSEFLNIAREEMGAMSRSLFEKFQGELEKVEGNLMSQLSNQSNSDKILEELHRERSEFLNIAREEMGAMSRSLFEKFQGELEKVLEDIRSRIRDKIRPGFLEDSDNSSERDEDSGDDQEIHSKRAASGDIGDLEKNLFGKAFDFGSSSKPTNEKKTLSLPKKENQKPASKSSAVGSPPAKRSRRATQGGPKTEGKDIYIEHDTIQARVGATLVNAYQMSKSAEEDLACAEELERAGVPMPNGWKPMSPLHMEEGEFMIDFYD